MKQTPDIIYLYDTGMIIDDNIYDNEGIAWVDERVTDEDVKYIKCDRTCPKCGSSKIWISTYKDQQGCDECGLIGGIDK